VSDADRVHGDEARQIERRRHPRRPPGAGVTLTLPTVVDAEVLDISAAGALISSSAPLKVGHRARLRMLLGREPFSARFEVRRTEDGTLRGQDRRHRLGVVFTAIEEQARRTLQRFVKADDRTSS